MRERCSRYSFILDISSLEVLALNSSSTQVLLVLVLISDFHDQYCCIPVVGSV